MNRPHRLDPLAERVLSLLAGRPEAGQIVLGGYVALQRHIDYRDTHDIDAWWKARADPDAERAIREAMETTAREHGLELRERRFGDTLSFELLAGGQHRFSFQIALRSVALEPPEPSPWPPVAIETLADNIGAKMNALVNRGAPRDFVDLYMVVERGLATVQRCWELWQAKNPGGSIGAARQNVLLHLSALEARRPLATIADSVERDRVRQIRDWFRDTFVRG